MAWISGKPPERTLSAWRVPENYERGSRSVTVQSGDALSRQNQEETRRDDGKAGGIPAVAAQTQPIGGHAEA